MSSKVQQKRQVAYSCDKEKDSSARRLVQGGSRQASHLVTKLSSGVVGPVMIVVSRNLIEPEMFLDSLDSSSQITHL